MLEGTNVVQAHDISDAIVLVQPPRRVGNYNVVRSEQYNAFDNNMPIMVSTPSSLHTRVANVTRSIEWPS